MNKKLLRTLLVGALGTTMALGLAACTETHTHTFSEEWEKDASGHWHAATCEHEGEKDAFAVHVYDNDEDAECNVCGYEREIEGPGEEFTAPVITLEFGAEVTVTAGEPIDPLFDVTATDEYDGDLSDLVDIENPDGLDFDNPAVGVYTVKYTVTNSKGKTGTAERTYTVEAPKPNVILEVETERDTANWTTDHEAGKMVFTNEQYIVLDENTEKTTEDGVDDNGKAYVAGVVYYQYAVTGIFYNSTADTIVVHMQGSGGEVAILDSAGFVVEARDGANGRFVSAEYPVRTSAPSTFLAYDGTNVAATNHGYYMQIPAGGWAVVVSNDGTFGEQGNFNADGRGWLNKNLVSQYGYVANLYFEDAPETLLNEYFDHAPVVLEKADVQVRLNDTSANIDELVAAGLKYTDDDGTWTATDDVTSGLTVEVLGCNPSFDVTVEGEYLFTLKITDLAGNSTEFTRKVIVLPAEATEPTIEIDGVWYNHATLPIGVNVDPSENPDNYYAIVYTSYYVGEFIRDDYGCYFVVDANGKVVETYQPQNGKYYRQGENGIEDFAKANTDILKGVEIPAGGYVVLAVYSADSNNFNVPMRSRILESDRMLGAEVKLLKIDYKPVFSVTKADGSVASYSGDIIVNADGAKAASQAFLVYTKAYKAEKLNVNGYGVAIVLDAENKIVKVYDGANSKYWDKDNADGVAAGSFFAAGTYAQDAFNALAEDETLVIFPNDGSNQAGSPRKFALDNVRTLGLTVTFTNFGIPAVEEEDPAEKMTLTINGATLELETVAINVDGAKPADYNIHVYTYGFEGTVITNGYGVAIVVKGGKTVRVYDGANGKYRDETQPDGNGDIKCASGAYVTEAFESLEEGEYMIVFPNGNDSRGWALTNARTVGAEVELVVPDWEAPVIRTYVKIGSAELDLAAYSVNEEVSAYADQLYIFTYGFSGTVKANGWGVAAVVKDGKIVRAYDGISAKYFDEENTAGVAGVCTAAGYLTEAFNSLSEGEYVLVFPNAAPNNTRGWGNTNARTIGAAVELHNVNLG